MVAVAKDGEYLTSRMMSPAILEAAGRELAPDAGFAPAGSTLKDKVESLERHILREALQRHKWNRSRVAEALGLSRVGLANKIRRYRLNEHR
jgi:two-component system response regulator HupR/HoxA